MTSSQIMRTISLFIATMIAACTIGFIQLPLFMVAVSQSPQEETIRLPLPAHSSGTSVEQALSNRRSVREYRDEPLSLNDVSQLLWAAQGVTSPEGFRTAPSAGALYPLEVYVVAGNVNGLRPGVYKYVPAGHVLELVSAGDKRAELSNAALGQPDVKEAAMDIVIAGIFERTTGKYSSPVRDERTGSYYPRGVGYVYMEAGHAAQNVCLQSESLNLGTVTMGAFSDDRVKRVTGMSDDERPLYILPAGKI
jgi:SagB-type dehydrogenase family enzyme